MAITGNFKDLVVGLILLIVLAAFTTVALADSNITGLAATVLTFIVPLAGVGLIFLALKGFGK